MLTFFALAMFATPPCVFHDKLGKEIVNPCGQSSPVTYQIPVAFADRGKDEALLTKLLNEHLAETQAGIVNLETLRKLNAQIVKVQKDLQNEYVHSK